MTETFGPEQEKNTCPLPYSTLVPCPFAHYHVGPGKDFKEIFIA